MACNSSACRYYYYFSLKKITKTVHHTRTHVGISCVYNTHLRSLLSVYQATTFCVRVIFTNVCSKLQFICSDFLNECWQNFDQSPYRFLQHIPPPTTTTMAFVRRYATFPPSIRPLCVRGVIFFFSFSHCIQCALSGMCLCVCRRVYTHTGTSKMINICMPVPVGYEILCNSNNQLSINILSVRCVEGNSFRRKCLQNEWNRKIANTLILNVSYNLQACTHDLYALAYKRSRGLMTVNLRYVYSWTASNCFHGVYDRHSRIVYH